MIGIYKGKFVEIVKIITNRSGYVTYPIIVQLKVKHPNGTTYYVDGNEVEFYDENNPKHNYGKFKNDICTIHTNTLVDNEGNCQKCLQENNK